MKKWICLPLCALFVAALYYIGLSETTTAAKHTMSVYFMSTSMNSGSVLTTESRVLDPHQDAIRQLIQFLLDGPKDADHHPALPDDVTLISEKLNGSVLTINFSDEYSELTGAALTVANASVVLTMTQLEKVDSVRILSAGEPVLPTNTAPLTAADFDLSGKSADPVTLKLPLYFPSKNGTDVFSEKRAIQASASSVSAEAQAVLDALCAGPETEGLRSSFPASPEKLTLKFKNKICSLTVDDEWRNVLLNAHGKATLSAWALTASLTELDGIDQVRYLNNNTEIPGLSEKEIAAVYDN